MLFVGDLAVLNIAQKCCLVSQAVRGLGCALRRKCVCSTFAPGVSYSVVGCESNVRESMRCTRQDFLKQKYTENKLMN